MQVGFGLNRIQVLHCYLVRPETKVHFKWAAKLSATSQNIDLELISGQFPSESPQVDCVGVEAWVVSGDVSLELGFDIFKFQKNL